MKEWYEYGPFSVFDLETTGMSPANNRIVEIAAIRIDLDGKISKFNTLVNPACPIPAQATRIHKITDGMVHNSPTFHNVGYEFHKFIKQSTLVAHNARFDLGFLQESFSRNGQPLWSGNTMDTLSLFRKIYPNLPKYNLQYLRERFGLSSSVGPAHRAFADVEWTFELLKIALETIQ